jgi:hypothetical protein
MATARRAEEESLIEPAIENAADHLGSRLSGCGLAGIEYIMFDASGCGADW